MTTKVLFTGGWVWKIDILKKTKFKTITELKELIHANSNLNIFLGCSNGMSFFIEPSETDYEVSIVLDDDLFHKPLFHYSNLDEALLGLNTQLRTNLSALEGM